jgi:hypothetical protein
MMISKFKHVFHANSNNKVDLAIGDVHGNLSIPLVSERLLRILTLNMKMQNYVDLILYFF